MTNRFCRNLGVRLNTANALLVVALVFVLSLHLTAHPAGSPELVVEHMRRQRLLQVNGASGETGADHQLIHVLITEHQQQQQQVDELPSTSISVNVGEPTLMDEKKDSSAATDSGAAPPPPPPPVINSNVDREVGMIHFLGNARELRVVISSLKQALEELSSSNKHVHHYEASHVEAVLSLLCSAEYTVVLMLPDALANELIFANECFQKKNASLLIADFFGTFPDWLPSENLDPRIPLKHYLTLYPHPKKTFLGFAVEVHVGSMKKRECLVLDKGVVAPAAMAQMLDTLKINNFTLIVQTPQLHLPHVQHRLLDVGMMSHADYHTMFSECSCIIGVGNLLHSSNLIEALSSGVMYLDPTYASTPTVSGQLQQKFVSQHPYLLVETTAELAANKVCPYNYDKSNNTLLTDCITKALLEAPQLKPVVPAEFTREAFRERLRKILYGEDVDIKL